MTDPQNGHPAPDERIRRLTHQSSLREKILEYRLLGELGVELLERDIDFTVLHSVSDHHGYDAVVDAGTVERHIQLKATTVGTTTRNVPISTRLAAKPSGCVIWMVFDPVERRFTEFRWFGAAPGQPLPDLGERPVRHSRANAAGVKAIRPEQRSLGLAKFERLSSIQAVADRLFGTEAG